MARVVKSPGAEIEGPFGVVIGAPSMVSVTGGEYPDEPDFVVHVALALDEGGSDISDELARDIAVVVQRYERAGQ